MTSDPAKPQTGIFALIISTGYQRRATLLAALALGVALTEGLGLVLFVPLLARLTGGSSAGGGLALLLAGFVALAVLRAALGYGRQVTAVRLRGEVVDRLRERAWDALLHAEWRSLREARRSDSASLLISEIDRLGAALSDALAALSLGATLLAVLAAGLFIAPIPMLAAGVLGLLAMPLLRRRKTAAAQLGEAVGSAYAAIHAASGETLAGLRVVKTLNAEAPTAARITAAQQALRRAEQGYWRLQGFGQVLLQAGAALALAGFVWISVTRLGAGASQLVPLAAVIVRAVPLLGGVHDAWLQWAHARPGLDALQALLLRLSAVRERGDPAASLPSLQTCIALEDITIRFSSELAPTLNGISLALPKHSITALEGPSGAGKSTLADVMGGLIAPDAGRVLIDGQPIAATQRREWRSRVAYVPQEPLMFAGSVRENLLLAAPAASDATLEMALRSAAAEFALTLPGGLDCLVGDGGRTLSGGEVQRIALARALLRQPELLILDEATSALDPANEELIAASLTRLKGQITILIIAHHGALTRLADRRAVLGEGRLAALH